jgi:hypothetical protein
VYNRHKHIVHGKCATGRKFRSAYDKKIIKINDITDIWDIKPFSLVQWYSTWGMRKHFKGYVKLKNIYIYYFMISNE